MHRKLPSSLPEPPGLERVIVRKIPFHLAAATLVPILVAWLFHRFPPQLPAEALNQHLTYIDIMTGALIITAWTVALTLAIGCFIVIVMKGHAYVADGYELPDAEQPAQQPSERD